MDFNGIRCILCYLLVVSYFYIKNDVTGVVVFQISYSKMSNTTSTNARGVSESMQTQSSLKINGELILMAIKLTKLDEIKSRI